MRADTSIIARFLKKYGVIKSEEDYAFVSALENLIYNTPITTIRDLEILRDRFDDEDWEETIAGFFGVVGKVAK